MMQKKERKVSSVAGSVPRVQFSQRTGHPSPGHSVLWEILTVRDGHEANRLRGSEVAVKAGVFGGA